MDYDDIERERESAHAERTGRWRPLFDELVGPPEAGKISPRLVAARLQLLQLEKALDLEILDPDLVLDPVGREESLEKRFRRKIQRAPTAVNAYLLGAAIGQNLPWSQGFLFLHAASHLDDFVGTLGSLEADFVRLYAADIGVLVQTAYAASYSCPENRPHDSIAKMWGDSEAERLRERDAARALWARIFRIPSFEDSVYAAFVKWRRQRLTVKFERLLGVSMGVARDRSFSLLERIQLLNRFLNLWLIDATKAEFDALAVAATPSEYLAVALGFPPAVAARGARLILMQRLADRNFESVDWFPVSNRPGDILANGSFGETLDAIQRQFFKGN